MWFLGFQILSQDLDDAGRVGVMGFLVQCLDPQNLQKLSSKLLGQIDNRLDDLLFHLADLAAAQLIETEIEFLVVSGQEGGAIVQEKYLEEVYEDLGGRARGDQAFPLAHPFVEDLQDYQDQVGALLEVYHIYCFDQPHY